MPADGRADRSLAPLFIDIVLDVIRDLRSAGELGILIVVQELPIALAIADHICVLDKGGIVFDGSPQELKEHPDIQARYIGISV